MLYPMRVFWSKLAIAVLVGALAIGGLTPVSAAGDGKPNTPVGSQRAGLNASTNWNFQSASTNWNFQMVFSTGTFTYLLQPLTDTEGNLSGTVLPPNTLCPGQVTGTLNGERVTMQFTFPGTPCAANSVNLTGKLSERKGTGSGTFTASFDCTGTCIWSGTKS